MKSVEFCYWLQGMFELSNPTTLDAAQTDLIKRHLAMVFHHEIDPSYGAQQVQHALNSLHGKPPAEKVQIGGQGPDGTIYRC